MQFRVLSTILLITLLTGAPLWAQTGAGNIQGTVKDATGAVVPGATVSITQTSTSLSTTTTTNGVGFYLFPTMQPGPYQITIEATGMERWNGRLTLLAGQSAEVNATLKVGATTTEVTVAGDVTPLVTTNSATLGSVVEHARIDQLPLDGRSVTNLIYVTTPGIVTGGNNNGVTVPRVNGLRYAAEMVQDGSVLENREWQSLPDRLPGLDSINEFQVETNNSSAKMNRPGTIILNTKAGTNQLHGALFETARNSGIGVARARQDYYLKPPHLVRNEFGASLGGPVVLPKVYNGKNRTFFFFAYEGYRLRQGTTLSSTVPTLAMDQGDFSGLVNNQSRLYALYNPWTTDPKTWARQQFSYNGRMNVIDPALQSPLAKYLLSVTQPPTTADNPLVASNWFGPAINNWNQATITTRVDQRLSDRDQLFFRYSHNPSLQTVDTNYPPTLDNKANFGTYNDRNDTAVADWTHTFSPTLFSETTFTIQLDHKGILPASINENVSSALGLPNPFSANGFPRISDNGFGNSYDPYVNLTIDYSVIPVLDENITKVKGRHEFQFGGRLRLEEDNILPDHQETQGLVDFGSLGTGLYDPASGSSYGAVPYTNFNEANLFVGVAFYTARFSHPWWHLRAGERSAYFQDNFKVNERLTLNMGLRYEYNTPLKERDNALSGFDLTTHAAVLPRSLADLEQLGIVLPALANAYAAQGIQYETPQDAKLPTGLVLPNKWDFGPRAGFAYRLGSLAHPTVLRGGYSIYAYPESIRLWDTNVGKNTPFAGQVTANPNSATQSPDGLPNYLLRSVPTIVAGSNSANALTANSIPNITIGTASMYFLDPHSPTARAHEWNFTIEREILSNTSAKISYIGTHGCRQGQVYSYNDAPNAYVWYVTTGLPTPTGAYSNVAMRLFDQQKWGTIYGYEKTGWSNDQGMQFEIQRRYSKGYGFQAFYVISNAMRAAGDGWRGDYVYPTGLYLPGIVPVDEAARNRFLNYRRDTAIPKHNVNWNWIADLPFGKGKWLAHNAHGLPNALIGGWQIAGYGNLSSQYFQLPTSYWGPFGSVQVYGKKYPIQDCRSGVCYSGWLYWNGYIPANRINSYDKNGKPNGVMGVPDSYQPFAKPMIPVPANGGSSSDPLYAFYDTNTVWVPLKSGAVQRTTYNAGVNPMQNQFVSGPMLWSMNASAFKSVQIKERLTARINVDFFNVFNMPGTTLPGSDGVITNKSSANLPRYMQLSLRLSW